MTVDDAPPRTRARKPKKRCGVGGCDKDSRANGYCDRHYRAVRRIEQGIGGITPVDGEVYKLRIRLDSGGIQPIYFSIRRLAYARAAREKRRGRLLYFARYGAPVDLLDDL